MLSILARFQHPRLIQCIYTSARHWFWIFFEHSLYWLLPDDSLEGSPIPSVIWRDCRRQSHPDPYGTFVQIRKRPHSWSSHSPGAKAASEPGFQRTISTAGHTSARHHWPTGPPLNSLRLRQACPADGGLEQLLLWVGQHARVLGHRGHDASSPSAGLQAREVGGASTRTEGRYRSAMLVAKAWCIRGPASWLERLRWREGDVLHGEAGAGRGGRRAELGCLLFFASTCSHSRSAQSFLTLLTFPKSFNVPSDCKSNPANCRTFNIL